MGFTMDWYVRAKFGVGLCLGLVMTWLSTSKLPAQAAATAADPGSAPVTLEQSGLSLAPADAAFYTSALNSRRFWNEQLESGWVAEFRRVPYVQQLEQFLQQQWDNPDPQVEQFKTVLGSPIVRDIANLLADMASRECFIYGDHRWCDFLEEIAGYQYEMSQLTADDPEQMREYFLALEKEDIDAIPIPTTIIGFQLSDQENARTQLDALEGIVQLALNNAEPLKPLAKRLRRKDLKNGQILSMTFAANDIPWATLPASNDDQQATIDHVASLLKDRQVVLSLGVVGSRLFVSISDTPETLQNLGSEGQRLLRSRALAPVIKSQATDMRGIAFASADWRNAVWQTNFGNYFERLAFQLTNAAISEADNPEELDEWQDSLVEDCQWLDEKIADLIPAFEDSLAYSFRSAEGTETFGYDWTPSWLLENGRPLAVTRHGGTGPLVLLASRQKWLEGLDEIATEVLDAIPRHFEALADAGVIEEDEADEARTVIEGVFPILEEIHAAIRDKIVPALDGNESLTAITAQTTVTQLGEDAPAPPQPLPLPEVGVVLKLKNRDQFLSGCDDILSQVNALLDFVREQDLDALPSNARVPEPKEDTLPGGTRYFFPLGAPAPFDQFELQMAINKEVAVLGYSTRQVKDLYQSRPLAARPGWYLPEQPTAIVGFVDVAGIFAAIKPWVHYGLSLSGKDLDEPLGPGQAGAPVPTGADILQMWDTFKKFGKVAGTTVIDQDDVTVSHWIWVGE